ncbi:hypothetical protein E4U58_000941 [Claviceps cyperi]|nr:hypothetical protein E4U58_000941 [Claviceps cyperi]
MYAQQSTAEDQFYVCISNAKETGYRDGFSPHHGDAAHTMRVAANLRQEHAGTDMGYTTRFFGLDVL